MFQATIYNHAISASNIHTLKRKASTIANRYNRPCDEMTVTMTTSDGEYRAVFYRINSKAPNNTIKRGEWR